MATITTYPANMVLNTFKFRLVVAGVIQDYAEFGIWGQVRPADVPDDWDAALLEVATGAYGSWVTNADASMWENSVLLESVKSATFGTDGKTTFEAIYAPDTEWGGSGSGGSLPWQLSFCCGIYTYTPETFIPDGKTRRGRIYLPPMTKNLLNDAPTGQLASGTVSDLLDLVNHLYVDISQVEVFNSSGMAVGVFSRKAQHLYAVTDFRADGKLDTQRRRTNREASSYQQRPFDATP